jgi:hypothetical protein
VLSRRLSCFILFLPLSPALLTWVTWFSFPKASSRESGRFGYKIGPLVVGIAPGLVNDICSVASGRNWPFQLCLPQQAYSRLCDHHPPPPRSGVASKENWPRSITCGSTSRRFTSAEAKGSKNRPRVSGQNSSPWPLVRSWIRGSGDDDPPKLDG